MLDLKQCLDQRKSVRAYTSQPVPQATLDAVFTMAQRAASNCNTQPWNSYVVSGDTCNSIRAAFYEAASTSVPPAPDFCEIPQFHDAYRDRQFECAMAMYGSMGISRDDKAGRWHAMLRNFELFDAPHAVFITMPKAYNMNSAIDVGMYLQTLMLAMTAHGIGSCAQGALALYPALLRQFVDIPEEEGVLIGASFGYELAGAAVNNTITSRADIREVVHFC